MKNLFGNNLIAVDVGEHGEIVLKHRAGFKVRVQSTEDTLKLNTDGGVARVHSISGGDMELAVKKR